MLMPTGEIKDEQESPVTKSSLKHELDRFCLNLWEDIIYAPMIYIYLKSLY